MRDWTKLEASRCLLREAGASSTKRHDWRSILAQLESWSINKKKAGRPSSWDTAELENVCEQLQL